MTARGRIDQPEAAPTPDELIARLRACHDARDRRRFLSLDDPMVSRNLEAAASVPAIF